MPGVDHGTRCTPATRDVVGDHEDARPRRPAAAEEIEIWLDGDVEAVVAVAIRISSRGQGKRSMAVGRPPKLIGVAPRARCGAAPPVAYATACCGRRACPRDGPDASAIWSPMEKTGQGGHRPWKAWPCGPPHAAHESGSSEQYSSQGGRPACDAAGRGPGMIDSAVTILPQPDSPTSPSTSPGQRELRPSRREARRRRSGTRREPHAEQGGRGPPRRVTRGAGAQALRIGHGAGYTRRRGRGSRRPSRAD